MRVSSHLHLRVKDTRILFHDTNSLIEGLQRVRCTCFIGNHSRQVKLQILRLQLRCEAIANAILLSTRDFNIVSRSREITNYCRSLTADFRRPEIAPNEDDGNGLRLFIANGEQGLGWVAVDELDAKDFG